jgi:SAM-dependent methyltransferase
MLKSIHQKLLKYGFDAYRFVNAFKNRRWFYKDLNEIKRQQKNDDAFQISKLSPILNERNEQGGIMKGHYFHQDLFIARKIFELQPIKHLDIGSRTDGFVAHVASFREIELIDIRQISSKIKNIQFRQANLMELPEDLIETYDSISSLHAIEHFGLGRYGDPIDYWGHLRAIENITKMLKQGGIFYFSVPIGPQRIEFNAHRVFSINYLLNIFEENYNCLSFSYVDDNGEFFENVKLNNYNTAINLGCKYGCGIFILSKK